MFRALFIKELREIWWLGLLPLGFMLYAISQEASYGHGPMTVTLPYDYWEKMPFSDASMVFSTMQWGCILAAALGLWQTFRETQSRTWHFLLHRPVNRRLILGAKVLAAASLYLLVIVLPVAGLALWASIPGTHASPFHWSLTVPVWYAVGAGTGVYLAAVFAGLRRGHIIGCRWWPLIGAVVVLAVAMLSLPRQFVFSIWITLLVWNVLLTAAIRTEMEEADFN